MEVSLQNLLKYKTGPRTQQPLLISQFYHELHKAKMEELNSQHEAKTQPSMTVTAFPRIFTLWVSSSK